MAAAGKTEFITYGSSQLRLCSQQDSTDIIATAPRRATGSANVERVLNDLANMEVADRPVLGDKNNIANAIEQARDKQGLTLGKPTVPNQVFDSSVAKESGKSDEQNFPTTPVRLPKAAQLRRLSKRASEATENATLGAVVRDLADVLRISRSKALTKDGFAVLDRIQKQLVDPSVYVGPLRKSQTRRTAETPAILNKLDVLARLRRSIHNATSNADMASMLQEFGSVIDSSNGRTVTKDALAFLEGLASRLEKT